MWNNSEIVSLEIFFLLIEKSQKAIEISIFDLFIRIFTY